MHCACRWVEWLITSHRPVLGGAKSHWSYPAALELDGAQHFAGKIPARIAMSSAVIPQSCSREGLSILSSDYPSWGIESTWQDAASKLPGTLSHLVGGFISNQSMWAAVRGCTPRTRAEMWPGGSRAALLSLTSHTRPHWAQFEPPLSWWGGGGWGLDVFSVLIWELAQIPALGSLVHRVLIVNGGGNGSLAVGLWNYAFFKTCVCISLLFNEWLPLYLHVPPSTGQIGFSGLRMKTSRPRGKGGGKNSCSYFMEVVKNQLAS